MLHGDPPTGVVRVAPGERLVFRALMGAGDQLLTHTLQGHTWRRDPAMPGSQVVDTETLGVGEGVSAWTTAGPGGPGDYLWGAHRDAFAEAGAWGILRVQDPQPFI